MPSNALALDAKFLIERKGKVIGYHHVEVDPVDDGYQVATNIEMKVKFGPITVFRYYHTSSEFWRDGRVERIDAKTNNNGKRTFMRAERSEDGLFIEGSDFAGFAPANAVPSTYWNYEITNADALINTQTGELVPVDVDKLGETPTPDAFEADQYRLTGTVALNLWYRDGQWVGCNFTVDGEELTYSLVESGTQFAELRAGSEGISVAP